MKIRQLEPNDWAAVRAIYEAGIATGIATFETNAPSWEAWDKSHASNCRFVAEKDGIIAGWVALTPVSSRCVYAGVGEVSVYIHPDFRGQGVGFALLMELIKASEAAGIWTLQAAMMTENIGSFKLHTKAGFRKIGYREKIGKLRGIWRDNILMERRSKVVL